MNINFQHHTKIRVRYAETDQMGYCYYGNYAQYFEVGRVEALRAIGTTYKSLEDSGFMLPVSELKINYLSPAKYDDEIIVITKVISLKGVRILFEYEIQHQNQSVICKGETTLVFVNKETMRPCSPPTSFLNLLSNYEEK